ncbi:MAG: serine/threonine-protein kinase, partial [Planctomycetaceae bacterium]
MADEKTQPDNPHARAESLVEATVVSDAIPLDATVSIAMPRGTIGRYKIDGKLGQGGMGTVYRAVDPDSGQVVAIKMMNASMAESKVTVERFHKETRLLAEVNNPWVTNLLDSGETDGVPFMVLEFVDGTHLGEELQKRKQLPESEALSIVADIARALLPAHERGIIHRDIKPSNVLLTPESDEVGSAYHVRLADFGLARHVDQSESMELTKTGTLLGTPLYMSPEQCRGQADIGPEA